MTLPGTWSAALSVTLSAPPATPFVEPYFQSESRERDLKRSVSPCARL